MPVKKERKKMTIEKLLFYMVSYKLLTPNEAEHCLRTSELPDSIMERLKIMERLLFVDKTSKN